jgi:hypothetical protein
MWVVTSKFTDRDGFSGFQFMLQLITDGLKLCPTSPTFIDLRDAILQADLVNNSGANQCILWEGFAERGLGYSATTAGSGSLDATDGFDVSPVACISSAGAIALDASSYTCGDTVGILMADSDLAGASTLDVLVVTTGGDSETVVLTETSSGVFSGSIGIQKESLSTNNGSLEGNFAQTITVTYNDADTGSGSPATVTDTADMTICLDTILLFDLDNNPGWTTEGAWAFGTPTGGGTNNGDPTSGHTGSNVYGFNLSGDYTNDLAETNLTTTALDFSGVIGVTLRFWRWLGIEGSIYDNASVRVSNDGSNWTTVWQHSGGDLSESAWSEQIIDISAVADNQSNVFVRWVMGTTDFSVVFPGWNIDDIEFEGIPPGPAAGSLSEAWVDFANTASALGTEASPLKTLADAITALVTDGTGTIKIKGNTADSDTSETFSGAGEIDNAMRIEASGGTVQIGVP